MHEDLETIRQRGLKFGELAKQSKKKLYIVNGPRTGKFYPESPDSVDPVLRQYNREIGKWILFDELIPAQKQITVNKLATLSETEKKAVSETLAHTHGAPLDPETEAFLQGVKENGLDTSQYQVFDFKMTPGKPVKSAYRPLIAALYQSKDASVACYSGESISYAEIGYLIPGTYAFTTATMNPGHQAALRRFSQDLHMVGALDLHKPIGEQSIDLKKKQESIQRGSQQDAARIASALEPILEPVLKLKEKVVESSSASPSAVPASGQKLPATAPAPTKTSSRSAPSTQQTTSLLPSWPFSKKTTVLMASGAVVVATGLFFWYRSSQTNSSPPISPTSAPKIKSR